MAESPRRLRPFELAAALTLILLVFTGAQAAPLASQGTGSPFRDPAFRGTSYDLAALDQPGCPVHLHVEGLQRAGNGLTISVRLSNLGDGDINRQVIGAWVLAPDGTVRGYQRFTVNRLLVESATGIRDLRIRTAPVSPSDVIVLAVQEAGGETPWWRDVDELKQQVRLALAEERASKNVRAGVSASRTSPAPLLRRR
jgi:hypothetical protein